MTKSIPIEVRYQHGNRIEAIGAYAEGEALQMLAELLRSEEEAYTDLVAASPKPTMHDVTILRHLRILPGDSLVDVQVEGDTMIVKGSRGSRTIIADYITYLRQKDPNVVGAHIHIEHFPNHTYVSPSAISLTITRI